jgi:hypothetical protein
MPDEVEIARVVREIRVIETRLIAARHLKLGPHPLARERKTEAGIDPRRGTGRAMRRRARMLSVMRI